MQFSSTFKLSNHRRLEFIAVAIGFPIQDISIILAKQNNREPPHWVLSFRFSTDYRDNQEQTTIACHS